MKSITKRSQLIFPIFLILLINSLCGGMLYDLGHRMPIWVKMIFIIVLIGYPILNIVAVLSIPTIDVQSNKLSATSFFKHHEVHFDDIINTDSSNFKNKVYKVGKFYTVYAKNDVEINIPYGVYKNEVALLGLIEKYLNK